MDIKIETDDSIVLGSGSLLVNYTKPLYFKMYNNTMNFKIVFEAFEKNLPETEFEILADEKDTFQIKIKFPKQNNFKTFTTEPLHLAFKDGKKIFLKFHFQYNDSGANGMENLVEDFVFNYTWLINK